MTHTDSNEPGPPGRSAVALLNDLIFATKIRSTGQSLGTPVRVVGSVAAMQSALAAAPADLLILDLNFLGDQVAAAIDAARRLPGGLRIVAYVSHVDQELARAAAAAGADEVMPRSQFVQALPELLKGWSSTANERP